MRSDASVFLHARPECVTDCGADAYEPIPDDWPGRADSRFIDASGARWHIQRTGAGAQMLLLHGTAASTHTWRKLMPLLSANYDVLAVDLPGHGFSERLPGNSMTLPAISEAIAGLLREVNFEPRCVVGHSAGAALALRMSLDGSVSPDCVVGLNAALLPFGGGLQRVFAPMAQLFANTALMPKLVAKRARDVKAVRRILKGTGSNLDDAGVELYQRLLQRESHVAAVLSMMANWDLQPLLNDLPQLLPRLLLVAGGRDKAVSPREADRVAAQLPRASVTRLDNCGHLAHEEQPEAVASIIAKACSKDGG